MSKIVILGDLHLGARNNSSHFAKYFNRFFDEVLHPFLEENGITTIIQLGDLFDNRTTLAYKTYFESKETWFDYLVTHNIKMHVLLGNHDILHKNSLQVNSPELLLKEYSDNINIIKTPTVLEIDGRKFDVVPWMCDENRDEILKFITRPERSPFCLGHFELSGFPMQKGGECNNHGEPVSIFDGYSQVISGHYHTKSERGNIIYSGIPYEISWSDYADPKFFLVYDTVTNKIEWIRNEITMFEKIVYTDKTKLDFSTVTGKIVKLIVEDKQDPILFERFIESLKLASPHSLDIVDFQDFSPTTNLDDSLDVTDTIGICNNYVDGVETTVDKAQLKQYIAGLYLEAQALDDRI